MTDWAKLAEPFPDSEIKSRPGRGNMTFRYVDARAVAQRLDDVLTPEGWDFTWSPVDGSVVHGRLTIGTAVREDAGYPNSDADEEPIKAAVSDALKRCAVLFGVGRHLYEDNSARPATRQAGPRPQVQVETRRPQLVDTSVPDEPDWLAPVGDDDSCPEHGIKWIGDGPTDWYHRKGDGGYCRHPMNKGKRAAR